MSRGASKRPGFAEELQYRCVDGEGKIRLKDGGLLGGFWFDGIDFESASESEIVHLVRSVNLGFRRLDGGWALHLETIRRRSREYTRSPFRCAVDQLLDDERADRAQHYRTDNAMFFSYLPSLSERNPLAQHLKAVLSGRTAEDIETLLERQKEVFEERMREIEVALVRGGLKVQRIGSATQPGDIDPLLSALNFCINGRPHPVRSTEDGHYLDVLLADDLLNDAPMRYGDRYVRVVSPTVFPRSSRIEMLARLCRLNVEFRWSTRFIFRSDLQNRLHFTDVSNKWSQQEESLWAHMLGLMNKRANPEVALRVEQVRQAKEELDRGVGYGRLTTAIVVMGDDDDDCLRDAQEVVKALQSSGFIARIERHNAMEALLGSYPGHNRQNVRKGPLSTINLTHLVSLGRDWEGEAQCPSPMYGRNAPPLVQAVASSGGRFFFNTHDGDLGHAIVVGFPGSGKSTLLATLASQFGRYPDGQVVCFDKGNSMRTLAWAKASGAHYELGAEKGPQLCPLARIDTPTERRWAAGWVEGLFEGLHTPLDDRDRELLGMGIEALSQSSRGAAERTLTHLMSKLQSDKLKRGLRAYAAEGSQHILNGNSDELARSRLTVFETDRLVSEGGRSAAPALRYIFHHIERDRLDGRPTLITLDEAWELTQRSSEGAEQIAEWYRTLRKKNASLVLASQSPKDFVDSPIADAVLQSCATRIFCANPEATSASIRSIYMDHFGLRDHQVTLLSKLRPKHEYLYACRGRVRVFSLDLGPAQLAFVGVSAKKDLKAVEKLRDEYGPLWPAQWLRHKELSDSARSLERLQDRLGEGTLRSREVA